MTTLFEALDNNEKALKTDIRILKEFKRSKQLKDSNKKWLERIERVSGEGSIPRIKDAGPFVDKDLKRFIKDSQKTLVRYTKLALKLHSFNKISKKIEKNDTLVSIVKGILKSKKFFNYWKVKETDEDAETFYRIINDKNYFNLTDPVAAYIGLHPNLSDVKKADGTSYSVGERIKLCVYGAEQEGLVKRLGCVFGAVEAFLKYGEKLDLFNESDNEPEKETTQKKVNDAQAAFDALVSTDASKDPDAFNDNLKAFYNAIKNDSGNSPVPEKVQKSETVVSDGEASEMSAQDVADPADNNKPAKKSKKA